MNEVFFNTFSERIKSIVESKAFNFLVTFVILVSVFLVGLSVQPSTSAAMHEIIFFVEVIILVFFSIEILMRIIAEGSKPLNFFKDSWNVMDFVIVLLAFLPIQNKMILLVRLVRVLRILRLFRAFTKLRLIINGMINSFASIVYVGMLLLILIYFFSVIGVSAFSEIDPINFGSMWKAFFTLFQVLTLEGWNTIMVPVNKAYPIAGPIYFTSFIIIGTMVVMNLILGVIVTNMNKAMKELDESEQKEKSNEELILQRVKEIEKELKLINKKLSKNS